MPTTKTDDAALVRCDPRTVRVAIGRLLIDEARGRASDGDREGHPDTWPDWTDNFYHAPELEVDGRGQDL